jgi:hypothetical protein
MVVLNTGALCPAGSHNLLYSKYKIQYFCNKKSAKARGLAIDSKTMEYQDSKMIFDGLKLPTLEFAE